jgi:hypothetical protein
MRTYQVENRSKQDVLRAGRRFPAQATVEVRLSRAQRREVSAAVALTVRAASDAAPEPKAPQTAAETPQAAEPAAEPVAEAAPEQDADADADADEPRYILADGVDSTAPKLGSVQREVILAMDNAAKLGDGPLTMQQICYRGGASKATVNRLIGRGFAVEA